MNKIVSAVQAFIADENGVTAIEYGLIAALMGAAVVVGVGTLSGGLQAAFTSIAGTLRGTA